MEACLEFQIIIIPDGLILRKRGLTAGYRHNWALYTSSEMERKLGKVLQIEEEQSYVQGDSEYNCLAYLDVPFYGAVLTPPRRTANSSTAKVRVTVEVMYRKVKLY